jgi:1,4-alpha-glucan branching enzyme
MISPSDYLTLHPAGFEGVPSASSWGARGYHEVWLNDATAWMYPHLLRAAERSARLEASASDKLPLAMKRRLLAQARRELLLGQSSDWPFMMNANRHTEYAEKRVRDHLTRFYWLADALEQGVVQEDKLKAIEAADNVFDADLLG